MHEGLPKFAFASQRSVRTTLLLDRSRRSFSRKQILPTALHTARGMPQFQHFQDKYGNGIWFGDGGDVRFAAQKHIQDYKLQLQNIYDMQLRPDDVLVDGYPKSGNNWIHHMVTMLVEGTINLNPINVDDMYVFIDSCGGDKRLPPPVKPRVLQSHLRFRYLPRDVTDKKVKVVYVTRNPKDVFVSQYCHLQNVHPPLGYEGTWGQFFTVMLEQGYWYGDIFEHVKDWEKEMNDHPELSFLHVSFEETKLDTLGQIERLNTFLGTERSTEFCTEVVNTCQFSNMQKARNYEKKIWQHTWGWKEEGTSFYRKGEIGDWKNWFTVAQNEEFDEVYRKKMLGSSRTFMFE